MVWKWPLSSIYSNFLIVRGKKSRKTESRYYKLTNEMPVSLKWQWRSVYIFFSEHHIKIKHNEHSCHIILLLKGDTEKTVIFPTIDSSPFEIHSKEFIRKVLTYKWSLMKALPKQTPICVYTDQEANIHTQCPVNDWKKKNMAPDFKVPFLKYFMNDSKFTLYLGFSIIKT